MRPILFEIGPLPIYAYGLMILVGFLTAMKIAAARFRVKGINPEYVYDLGLVAMIFGILGARIFYLIQYHNRFDWRMFYFGAGISWFGAVLGLMVFWACYRSSQARLYLSIAALALILGKHRGIIQPTQGEFHWLDVSFILLTGYFLWREFCLRPEAERRDRGGIAFWNYWKNASKLHRISVLMGAVASIVVGMRFLHWYRFSHLYSWDVFMIWKGGLVFYGGFLLAMAAVIYFLKRKNLPIFKIGDLIMPGVALGLAFARIGCFCNGCCFGGFCPQHSPWGVHYPPNSLVGEKNVEGINAEPLWSQYLPEQYYQWLKHPLMSIDIKYRHELNKKHITDELCRLFEKRGFPLSRLAMITYTIPDQRWQLNDEHKKTHYNIRSSIALLFKSNIKNYEELKKDYIPENLRREFAKNACILSPAARVEMKTPNTRWWLLDEDRKYVLIVDKDTMLIYGDVLNVYYPLQWHELARYLPRDLYYQIFHPVYPSQLIGSLTGFSLFLLLTWLYRYRRYDGELLLVFCMLYGTARFLLEMLRDDTFPVLGTGLTAGQFTSCILFCISTSLFIFFRIKIRLLRS